jgi:hypothetical protein
MAHCGARNGKWRGNWRMEWVAITLHTTSEHGVFSITTASAHKSAASSRMNWRSRRFKWTRPFRRKTKSGFCAYVVTFQTQSNITKPTFCPHSVQTIFRINIKLFFWTPITDVSTMEMQNFLFVTNSIFKRYFELQEDYKFNLRVLVGRYCLFGQ